MMLQKIDKYGQNPCLTSVISVCESRMGVFFFRIKWLGCERLFKPHSLILCQQKSQ